MNGENGFEKLSADIKATIASVVSAGRAGIVATAIYIFRAGVLRDIEDAFASKKSPDGTSWPPRKDKKTHPLLILSGDMMAAALASIDRGTESEDGVVIPLNGPDYRLYHHFGTSRMPQRRFYAVSSRTESAVAAAVENTAANLFSAALKSASN